MIQSARWLAGFDKRDRSGKLSAADMHKMQEHIRSSCKQIQAGWDQAAEHYRRTGTPYAQREPLTVQQVPVRAIAAAARSGKQQD